MSKQLTLSATAAVLSMVALAFVSSAGMFGAADTTRHAAQAPLVGLEATR